MMKIVVERNKENHEWFTIIPNLEWKSFKEFTRETRLPWMKVKTGPQGVMIRLPSGWTIGSLEETLVHFFDGIADVELKE